MIRSMTGFARRERGTEFGVLSWEIRSVNHRYLEPFFRLPEDFRSLEQDLRRRLSGAVSRGKVECTLRMDWSGPANDGLAIDEAVLDEVARAIATVSGRLAESGPSNPVDVLRWPGVLRDVERDPEPARAAAADLFSEAVTGLVEAREAEGARIAEMLDRRCRGVEALVAEVRIRLPDVITIQRDRLRERVAQLAADLDPDRLEQELALLAQKMDVSEELDRLESHVTEVARALESGKPVGRRLDFLMQEFNREANTLASKSADSDVTRAAVDLKVLIEQMREQVQNVE